MKLITLLYKLKNIINRFLCGEQAVDGPFIINEIYCRIPENYTKVLCFESNGLHYDKNFTIKRGIHIDAILNGKTKDVVEAEYSLFDDETSGLNSGLRAKNEFIRWVRMLITNLDDLKEQTMIHFSKESFDECINKSQFNDMMHYMLADWLKLQK